MSTSQSEDFEGLLHMKRGKFNESVNALERALRAIYGSPKKVFDRLRTDESFARRIAGLMNSGGYTKNFYDVLAFKIPNYENGQRPWKYLRRELLSANFTNWPDEEGVLEAYDRYVDEFLPITDKKVAVELISFHNIPDPLKPDAFNICAWLQSYGLRPLTILELWALGAENPKICLDRTVVGLGSYINLEGGNKIFPSLGSRYKNGTYRPCISSVSDDQQLFNHYSFAAVSRFIK